MPINKFVNFLHLFVNVYIIPTPHSQKAEIGRYYLQVLQWHCQFESKTLRRYCVIKINSGGWFYVGVLPFATYVRAVSLVLLFYINGLLTRSAGGSFLSAFSSSSQYTCIHLLVMCRSECCFLRW